MSTVLKMSVAGLAACLAHGCAGESTTGLKERDLQVMTQTSAPAFRVRLVGKDGGVKLDVGTPMTTDALFALIDAMPMRQDEMSNR